MVAEGLAGVLDGVRVALDVALAVPLYCRRADDVADGLLAVQAIRAQAEALACSYAQSSATRAYRPRSIFGPWARSLMLVGVGSILGR